MGKQFGLLFLFSFKKEIILNALEPSVRVIKNDSILTVGSNQLED